MGEFSPTEYTMQVLIIMLKVMSEFSPTAYIVYVILLLSIGEVSPTTYWKEVL